MLSTLQKLILTGDNLIPWLQRLITQDVLACQDQPKLSALCSPHGKVLFVFWIQAKDKKATLWSDQSMIQDLKAKLTFYDPFSSIVMKIDERLSPVSEIFPESKDTWALTLIQKGILPISKDHQKYTPQILRLDELGAISFSKGCYVGHEPISRLQFKGNVKRKLKYLKSPSESSTALYQTHHDGVYHCLEIQPV